MKVFILQARRLVKQAELVRVRRSQKGQQTSQEITRDRDRVGGGGGRVGGMHGRRLQII